MTIAVYVKGSLVRLSTVIDDLNGQAVDPTAVQLDITKPVSGLLTKTYAAGEITRDALGNYHFDADLDEAGRWYYKWSATGTGQSAEEGELVVVA